MQVRRNLSANSKLLTGVLARLSQAMGIDKGLNGISVLNNMVWIEARETNFSSKIEAPKRIGVNYAGEDANLLWRFSIIGNKFVSK